MIKKFETTFNSYESISIVGEGGAGYVYKVKDENQKEFAIKLLKPDAINDKERMQRFKNELNFCKKNIHKNIIKIIDDGYEISSGVKMPFYVMPFYDLTLRKIMKQTLPQGKIIPIFSLMLDGVEAAHIKGVWHRDIKPENILLGSSLEELVISDFGIAHFSEEELFTLVETSNDSRLANFQYNAPEQKRRDGLIDRRTDIYALGLILNEMFTKEIPQGTKFKTISAITSEYEYLDSIVEQMISQSKDDRPKQISEIKNLINQQSEIYLQSQKISKIDSTVIPENEIDDQIIANPIKLIGFDWDESRDILYLNLSQPINEKWKDAFNDMGTYEFIVGKDPSVFKINGSQAVVSAHDHEIQAIIDCFKKWLNRVSVVYAESVKIEHQRLDYEKSQKLAHDKEIAERKKKVLENVKI